MRKLGSALPGWSGRIRSTGRTRCPCKMEKQTALITGASSGIGLHLAHIFAANGHDTVLVAPVDHELREVAADVAARHGRTPLTIAVDLTREGAVTEILEVLGGRDIEILVNNAGFGKKGDAWQIPLEDDIAMVRLNVEAILRLNKAFLPAMVERGSGRILHTSSIAGFEPGPGHTVYAATKAFVLHYSEALATELENSGVTVTALCPGPTDTDFFPKAGMTQTAAFQKAQVMAPQDVAEDGYKALMRGDRVVVCGLSNKAMIFARRLLPESVQAKMTQALTSDVGDDQVRRERGDVESSHETHH